MISQYISRIRYLINKGMFLFNLKGQLVVRRKEIIFLNRILVLIALIVSTTAIINLSKHRWENYFKDPTPKKDEIGFVHSLEFYEQEGWYKSVSQGSSILFNFCASLLLPFTLNSTMALKWISLLSMLTLILIWSWFLLVKLNLRKQGLVYGLLGFLWITEIGVSKFAFFTGGSDGLFILFISISIIQSVIALKKINNRTTDLLFLSSGVFFGFALAVRELVIFYIPGVILFFLSAKYLRLIRWKSLVIWTLAFICITTALHLPSIIENGKLSVHNKNPEKETWAELNYLWIIKKGGEKPTFEEVRLHKKMFGDDALPHTYLQSLTRNFKITILNYLRLQKNIQLPYLRQTGIFYPVLLLGSLLWFLGIKKVDIQTLPVIFYFLGFSLFLTLSMVWMLEFRWHMAFLFIINVYGFYEISNHTTDKPIIKTLVLLNIIIISSLNAALQGIW